MIKILETSNDSTTARWRKFERLVALAGASLGDRDFAIRLKAINRLLNSLPLRTEEIELRRVHLHNAIRYQAANELGAARFELGILRLVQDRDSAEQRREA